LHPRRLAVAFESGGVVEGGFDVRCSERAGDGVQFCEGSKRQTNCAGSKREQSGLAPPDTTPPDERPRPIGINATYKTYRKQKKVARHKPDNFSLKYIVILPNENIIQHKQYSQNIHRNRNFLEFPTDHVQKNKSKKTQ